MVNMFDSLKEMLDKYEDAFDHPKNSSSKYLLWVSLATKFEDWARHCKEQAKFTELNMLHEMKLD